ncbi:GyrI-like domain-containing protein [Ornithinibacillus xuwenensis]|uniref:Effector binding domain-containing protein n=1 Tax=Ornithinibacillus xuwenensis TaxID=3144668 RepID=A0ABU9XHY6_9BACI
MNEKEVSKLNAKPLPIEDYKPQPIPQSLKVILGEQKEQGGEQKLEATLVKVDSFQMLATKVKGKMKNFEAGKEVRKGWRRLQDVIAPDRSILVEENEGIVFYNQADMVQPDGSIELWVGVKVNTITTIPAEFQLVTIPERKYAKIECRCFSREQMDLRYNYLSQWMNEEGYQLDDGPNAFSLEPNRLDKFNTFEVPADQIQAFDFDILYPVKEG